MKFKPGVVKTVKAIKDALAMIVILSMIILLFNGIFYDDRTIQLDELAIIIGLSIVLNIPYIKEKLGAW